ncbi:MAG: hypothetical protein K8S23_07390 [Candidatus Cloacimonetes bacterium]|nr:hypothetical protein [Candidatus Cloacimonadota bacterium]
MKINIHQKNLNNWKNIILEDRLVVNDKILICVRLYQNSCYIFYLTNKIFCLFQHKITDQIGFRIIIIQLVLNELAKSEELVGILGLDEKIISCWINEYKLYGAKSYFYKKKEANLLLNELEISQLNRIFKKEVGLSEIKFLKSLIFENIEKFYYEKFLIIQTIKTKKNRKDTIELSNKEKCKIQKAHKIYL